MLLPYKLSIRFGTTFTRYSWKIFIKTINLDETTNGNMSSLPHTTYNRKRFLKSVLVQY